MSGRVVDFLPESAAAAFSLRGAPGDLATRLADVLRSSPVEFDYVVLHPIPNPPSPDEGESGYTAPDPLNPSIMFGGTVTRCNVETGESKNVTPEVNLPAPPRHTWTNPLVFSAADPHALYFGDQFVFKTTDGGEHWTRISDDLTRPNPADPPNLDASTAADFDANRGKGGVVYTIAPSALRAPLIWIGTHRLIDFLRLKLWM